MPQSNRHRNMLDVLTEKTKAKVTKSLFKNFIPEIARWKQTSVFLGNLCWDLFSLYKSIQLSAVYNHDVLSRKCRYKKPLGINRCFHWHKTSTTASGSLLICIRLNSGLHDILCYLTCSCDRTRYLQGIFLNLTMSTMQHGRLWLKLCHFLTKSRFTGSWGWMSSLRKDLIFC